jgi:hypothetical protein
MSDIASKADRPIFMKDNGTPRHLKVSMQENASPPFHHHLFRDPAIHLFLLFIRAVFGLNELALAVLGVGARWGGRTVVCQ